ncbi:hypothetical protein [Portibacter marinus]|uniref:hypothetical protein n=1 Tax=Portibacter marinus TaxID=2898660 RepID=UPI001F1FE485|nr:hypothetical protein [Portibacter marinus]
MNIFKSLMMLPLFFLGTFVMNGQSAENTTNSANKTENLDCKPVNCDPSLCDAMVAAGLCTREQAERCKANSSKTKVASVRLEKQSNLEKDGKGLSHKGIETKETNVQLLKNQADKNSCLSSCKKSKTQSAIKTTP